MYLLYSSLLAIGFLISIPYWAFQMLRHGKYGSGLGERLGRVAGRPKGKALGSAIWVPALSVGEGGAVAGIISTPRPKLSPPRGGGSASSATIPKTRAVSFRRDKDL